MVFHSKSSILLHRLEYWVIHQELVLVMRNEVRRLMEIPKQTFDSLKMEPVSFLFVSFYWSELP